MGRKTCRSVIKMVDGKRRRKTVCRKNRPPTIELPRKSPRKSPIRRYVRKSNSKKGK